MNVFEKADTVWQKPWLYWPLLPAIALATPLTFAPYYHFWLMPLLFGALIKLTELRPQYAARSAYLFGLIGYTAQFYWIHTALHTVSGLPNLYAVPLTFLLPAFLALYPAVAFWLANKFNVSRTVRIGLVIPLVWTLTEFARERLLTGFAWGALGYSQIADFSPLAGFAPLGGIHLVTLATALTGAWLVLLLDGKRGRLKQRAVAAGALVAVLSAGYIGKQIEFTRPDGSSATVALAQGNIPQTLKWTPEQFFPTVKRYYEQVAGSRADIVILPETAIPMMRQDLPQGLIDQFAARAKANGSALAIGISQYTSDGLGYENAVINLTDYQPERPDHIPYYAKNHLVPFGEYKPLPWLTEPLYQLMNMPLADFKRGGDAQTPFQMANQKVAFNICYEDGFGDELIASAKQSTLLANASNMAWYGKSNAMFQHLQQSQARSMELGRYMVRSTNTGATAIIDPKGRIVSQTVPDTEAVLEGKIEGYTGETPYMKMGGSLPLIILLGLAAAVLFAAGKRRR
ncbi:apolipoprotein N-acyltransferase [Neisseria zoodegmatis]|uniref:Apolipoprotein N-acyltransferase n=1 Tax=Neisseria zoodegmatis TaxID=326523 RepID=A0AB38DR63_9NEIS|nr:apolipoprotein N-acyltransferase [Neisseria zoodegmatis]OSI09755.1 apolipoprotein N-acyltransferase [Neisseria zoodegmatis]SNU79463.1 apolipoprotein N-acyltransferase [Neisseria zoodegmatis]